MERPTKPYLESVEETGDVTPLRWAKYLTETFGTSGALGSLHYYERLGWITPSVTAEMVGYLRGLSVDELHNKKYDDPATLERPLESLTGTPFGAHARSLEFVAEMAGHDLEEQLFAARLAGHRAGRTGTENGSGDRITDGGFDDSGFEPLEDR
jgi:archaellum component FlaD/FlaE